MPFIIEAAAIGRRSAGLLLCAFVLVTAAAAAEPSSDANASFFEEQVHPILAKRCYECHGPEKQESGLRLDSRDAILRGGETERPGAVAGDASKSLLIQAVRYEGDLQMPPDEKLPDAEIAVLAEWVARGLPWGKTAAVKVLTMDERAEQARSEHWSLQPVRRPSLPAVQQAGWPTTPVDSLILARLEGAGLSPSPAADRRTLIRRLSFDLWGLPPSPEDVAAFIADPAPDAYARLVDRWLASPKYGERWGRHWLDVARYADTRGYAFANDRRYPYAYTYRDYVIEALNADKPYDEFVLEQLAADQLPVGEDKSRLAAMGFLTTGRKFNNRQDDLDDQIDVVSRGLLGMTVACARCHDHKYDPIPTEDYYSLYGVFASSREPDQLPLIAEPKQSKAYEVFQQELAKRQQELESFRQQKHAEMVQQAREKVGLYLVRLAAAPTGSPSGKMPTVSLDANDLRPRLLERWRALITSRSKPDDPVFGPWKDWMSVPDAEFASQATRVADKWRGTPAGTERGKIHPKVQSHLLEPSPTSRQQIAERYGELLVQAWKTWQEAGGNEEAFAKLSAEDRQLAEVIAGKDSPTDIPLNDLQGYLNRADRNKQRELEKKIQAYQATSPAAPPRAMVLEEEEKPHDPRVFLRGNAGRPGKPVPRQFLLAVAGPQREPFQVRSGRLELAQAIVDPANPLTRRVIVNRIWMHHFGQSLVRTPSDFGVRCDPPLQAELLDYLAARLLEENWSLKALHREILLSSVYRQSSALRQDGAERDPENRLLWRMNRRRLEFEPLRDSLLAVSGGLHSKMGGRPVDLFQAPYSGRRSIYGTIDRQDLPNLLRVFDFASPDQSQAERPRTSVPQQALYLMNSPFVLERAQQLAAHPDLANVPSDRDKLEVLYQRVFQRDPSSREAEQALAFVHSVARHATVPDPAAPGGAPSPEPAAKEPAAEGATPPGLSPWEQLAQLLLLTNEFAFVD